MTHVATWGSIVVFFVSSITFSEETWLVLKTVRLYLNQAFQSLTFLQCVDVLKVVKFHFYIQPARIYDRWAA